MGSNSTPTTSPATPQCAREGCFEPAVKRGDTGPPRRYCTNACRQGAYRQRQRLGQANADSDKRDVLGEAVTHLNETFAALPGETKTTRYGRRLMTLALELDRYHRGTLD